MLSRLVIISSLILLCTGFSVQANKTIDSLFQIFSTSQDQEEKLKAAIDLSKAYYRLDRDSSLKYDQVSLALAEAIDHKLYIARAKIGMAQIYQERQQIDTALTLLDEALDLATEVNDFKGLMELHNTRGMIHHYAVDYNLAIEEYQKAIDYAQEAEEHDEISRLNYNISNIFMQNQLYDKSKIYLERTVEMAGENTLYRALGYMGLASACFEQGSADQGIVYTDQLFEEIKDLEVQRPHSWFYRCKGMALEQEKKYEEAKEFYEKAIDVANEFNIAWDLTGCYCLLAKNALFRESPQEARRYFDLFAQHNEAADYQYMDRVCLMEWAKFEHSQGNHAKASQLFLEQIAISDSLNLRKKIQVMNEIETRYQTSKKDSEIAQQQLKIARQTNTRNLLYGAIGLLGLLGSIVYGRIRLRQKITRQQLALEVEKNTSLQHRQKLLAIDYMVQGQEEERKRIAKDLHDGLGSLLSAAKLQLGNIQREMKTLKELPLFEQTENLIGNAHDEVRRIAHNMMPEALMKFGLAEAIQDLAHQINVAHDVQVVTNLQTDTVELSEEREVTLYRIAQEAITNALRHARASKIKIDLWSQEEGLSLRIDDDGIGFDKVTSSDGTGLKNMQSRASYLNGTASFGDNPDGGTRVEVWIPHK